MRSYLRGSLRDEEIQEISTMGSLDGYMKNHSIL